MVFVILRLLYRKKQGYLMHVNDGRGEDFPNLEVPGSVIGFCQDRAVYQRTDRCQEQRQTARNSRASRLKGLLG